METGWDFVEKKIVIKMREGRREREREEGKENRIGGWVRGEEERE